MNDQPNIILFFTDQLRQDALGCYGNGICKTPNLDRLASAGVIFNHAYTTSPVCSPSRASLMSGQYPHNHGVMINTHIAPAWTGGLDETKITFSRLLKEKGYTLDYLGKWHVNQNLSPEHFGFDQYNDGDGSSYFIQKMKKKKPETERWIEFPRGKWLASASADYAKENDYTWALTDGLIGTIEERCRQNKPFFIRMDTPAPHHPNVIPEPYASRYDPESIPPWENFAETFNNKPAGHLRKHTEWNLMEKDWSWWSEVVAKYYGDVSLIDDCVGRVLKTIKDRGLEDNTIFIFSTDHGDALGSHKHFEKAGTMYDEIFKIPLIIRGPSKWVKSRLSHEFVRLMDLMPTMVDWAGGDLPINLDAISMMTLLAGDISPIWPDSVYTEHHGEVWGYQTQRMVRTLDWKYVYCPHDMDELYDLSNDPFEMRNLINDSKQKEILDEMRARLIGWSDATNDMFQWDWVRWNFPEPVLPKYFKDKTIPERKDMERALRE